MVLIEGLSAQFGLKKNLSQVFKSGVIEVLFKCTILSLKK